MSGHTTTIKLTELEGAAMLAFMKQKAFAQRFSNSSGNPGTDTWYGHKTHPAYRGEYVVDEYDDGSQSAPYVPDGWTQRDMYIDAYGTTALRDPTHWQVNRRIKTRQSQRRLP
jgi:hypothetical protein